MTSKHEKTCPIDGSALMELGSHGIVDWEGNWDAETTKYECADKKHVIFVADKEAIEDSCVLGFELAEKTITRLLTGAFWDRGMKSVRLPIGEEYGPPIKSLDDLRDALAQRAIESFKAWDTEGTEEASYPYTEAIGDVDVILVQFGAELKGVGWLPEKGSPKS
jgi:hypothetical protein